MTPGPPDGDGPLSGLAVVELAGLGPAPFCGMVLADMGADVIRVDRTGPGDGQMPPHRFDLHNRGKRSISIDLKSPGGREALLRLVSRSEAIIEGFRPGVVERLGVGPADCLARNPALIYGRMTGWGQEGPLSTTPGHDIDYIAMSGALGLIGDRAAPLPPLNLVGDFGGGGMLLAVGVLAGLLLARSTGRGQVIDASMVEGSALLTTSIHGLIAAGTWVEERGSNLLDGGAPFYSVYETSDGRQVAVGALEPQFFAALVEGLGLDPEILGEQLDRRGWPRMRAMFAKAIGSKTRDEWEQRLSGTDACLAPVLTTGEARAHPSNVARSVFVEIDGVPQPGPAPRFSSTPVSLPHGPPEPGSHTDQILTGLGYSEDQIGKLRRQGAVA